MSTEGRRYIGALVVGACAAACGRVDFDAGPVTYREQVLADRPLGYWRLADDGAVALDETAHGDGTYAGACGHGVPGALTGDADAATAFDGTDPCTVMLGDRFAFPGTAAFSLEAWIFIDARTGGEYVLMKEDRTPVTAESPIDGYGLIVNLAGVYGERVVDGDLVPLDVVPLPQRWTHVVLAYDGTQMMFYLDGQLASYVADPRAMRTYSADATIGGLDNFFAATDGTIDEVAIYDHALSPVRVSAHYDVGAHGPSAP